MSKKKYQIDQGFANILDKIDLPDFEIIRRSNPDYAFNLMIQKLRTGVREDLNMKKAFKKLLKNFNGEVIGQKEASRFKEFEKLEIPDLGIKVGTLPLSVGPGIVFLYDAAIESLRSNDKKINPKKIDSKMLRDVRCSIGKILPFIGTATVTALELSAKDKTFRDKLAIRGKDIGVAFRDNWDGGVCEFCRIERTDENGNITSSECATEDECGSLIFVILVILAILALKEIWDWIW